MKLTRLVIHNFRSCKCVQLEMGGLHALVGGNNAGKSTILKAVDFLLNPSARSINAESFWGGDTNLEIRVEGVFSHFAETEKQELEPYLRTEGTFWMARSARIDSGYDTDSEEAGEKVIISQHYKQQVSTVPWLNAPEINAANISKWWEDRDKLIIEGESFSDFLGDKKPTVAVWKEKAEKFIELHKDKIPMEDIWFDNPKGYANVLKGALPLFVLVPAVFGKLKM